MQGTCLCGSVQYNIEPPFTIFQYCHCSRCRKFTGSAFAANLFVPAAQFSWITGSECIRQYALPNAKYFATAFCLHCGSSMPWKPQRGDHVIVPAGTLDENPQIQPQQAIFCASQPDWYVDPKDLPKHDNKPNK